jgi:hypothetical protein
VLIVEAFFATAAAASATTAAIPHMKYMPSLQSLKLQINSSRFLMNRHFEPLYFKWFQSSDLFVFSTLPQRGCFIVEAFFATAAAAFAATPHMKYMPSLQSLKLQINSSRFSMNRHLKF